MASRATWPRSRLRAVALTDFVRQLSSSSGATFPVINPATGQALADIPEDSPEQVAQKFAVVQSGQKKWEKTPLENRKAVLRRCAKLLMGNAEELAQTLTAEVGKPISQARNEIRATGLRLNYFADNAHRVLEPVVVQQSRKMTERIVYEPLGVVANISAWNYPYFVAANVFGAALASGNGVLFKPSELASLSGLALTSLLHQAGIPEDVFVTATGRALTGAAVASQKGLGGIFFTGSYHTGVAVAQLAAPNLVKVQLELGGKDPVYVRGDVADVAAVAASLADGAFYNCGQSCCSVERIYVHSAVAAPFIRHFVEAVKGFKVGDPTSEDTYIGPLTRSAQLRVLEAQVEDALAKGATRLVPEEPLKFHGNFFPPTVLVNVNHSMSVMRDESFGPIIGIQVVGDDDEAMRLMADTTYGLTAGVYCQHSADAEAILADLNVGTGYWNCCDRSVPQLPWSGRRGSGLGVTLSLEGLRAMVRPKALHLKIP